MITPILVYPLPFNNNFIVYNVNIDISLKKINIKKLYFSIILKNHILKKENYADAENIFFQERLFMKSIPI